MEIRWATPLALSGVGIEPEPLLSAHAPAALLESAGRRELVGNVMEECAVSALSGGTPGGRPGLLIRGGERVLITGA